MDGIVSYRRPWWEVEGRRAVVRAKFSGRAATLAPHAALGTASPRGLADYEYPQGEYDLDRLPRWPEFLPGMHMKVGANAGAQRDQRPNGFSSLFLAQTMFAF
jgi:hypothetical protein